MGCNTCKNKSLSKIDKEIFSNKKEIKKSKESKIRNYFFNVILFLFLTIILVPIIVPAFIYILFKSIVLEKAIDIYPLLTYIGKKIVNKYGDDEYDDEEDITEYDDDDNDDENYEYDLENPNDIINVKNT